MAYVPPFPRIFPVLPAIDHGWLKATHEDLRVYSPCVCRSRPAGVYNSSGGVR